MAMDNIYSLTVKLFGSHPEPAFESAQEQIANWGRHWGCDNDVGQIRAILMHRPGPEFNIIDPNKRIDSIGSYGDTKTGWYFQSDELPNLAEMQAQHDKLSETFRQEQIEVIPLTGVEGHRFKSCYTRDSSLPVKGGAIVCRLAPRMRRGEEKAVSQTLANLGMPILRTIHGTGMVEGGSFAWINSKNAVIGRSIRVNNDGIEQVAEVLKYQGTELHVIDLNGYSIHIDGHFLMIDVDLALVHANGLNYMFLEKLKELKIRTIEITPEDDPWIINGLAIRPGRVILPRGISDYTREKLEKNHIDIIEIDYDKMHHNGGGIHCSTCPLIRDSVD